MYDKSTFFGIDAQQSREHARAMRTGAGQLDGIVGQIGSLLDSVQWSGPGADRFVGEWSGALRPELRAAAENIRENSVELDRRAQMQEDASR